MSDKGDFLAGLIVGGLMGLAAGVLFAPGSGEETRSVVRDRASDTLDRVRDMSGQVRDNFDRVRDGADRLREGVDRVREGVGQVTGAIRERFAVSGEPPAEEPPATPAT